MRNSMKLCPDHMSARTAFNYTIVLLIGISLGITACVRIVSRNEKETTATSKPPPLATSRALASEEAWDTELSQDELDVRRTPVVKAIEQIGPVVVNIGTEKIVRQRFSPFSGFRDDFFDNFFDPYFDRTCLTGS